MGFDYALVHLKYTIPPAIALTLLYRPLLTHLDVYKLCFLVSIAVVSTIPWDSYLIKQKIWSYPAHVVTGPTVFAIPIEELFFFIIQTYNTTYLYFFLSKPILHPAYLVATNAGDGQGQTTARSPTIAPVVIYRTIGQIVIGFLIVSGAMMVAEGKEATYMGLILVWAGPFLFLLWWALLSERNKSCGTGTDRSRSLAYQLIIGLPLATTFGPIVIPTLYLWVIDTLELKRGTWVIESGTKLGIHLWEGLEIEEAVFFLATNTLIVFGLVAFDNAIAIMEAFPSLYPNIPTLPTPNTLVRALLLKGSRYDAGRLSGISEALARLRAKSRSFYLASAFFTGRLRLDLMLLYSFARAADDLVDNTETSAEAESNCAKLKAYLDLCYGPSKSESQFHGDELVKDRFIRDNFPTTVHTALSELPTGYLSSRPLYELLEGFRTDLEFSHGTWPIASDDELELYAARVAGTVSELCLELVFHYHRGPVSPDHRLRLVRAGGKMGIALQCVNIARDISVDAKIDRVYIPTTWLQEVGLTPKDILKNPHGASASVMRKRMLDKAEAIYRQARPAIEELPAEVRGPMRVAVESYMEIGRVLREEKYKLKAGRATVPKLRRLRVALSNASAA
ncbi:MAG: hypothetical protein M1837_002646 [Sclerophora amabilis]|nr:MAG: hypothetical protein M1837_002646 [Sclerophora amabilis]